jgi:hypothetical protein
MKSLILVSILTLAVVAHVEGLARLRDADLPVPTKTVSSFQKFQLQSLSMRKQFDGKYNIAWY